MRGLNIDQTIGGNRRLAASPDGACGLLAEGVLLDARLLCLESSGAQRWNLARRATAADFLDDGHAYVLTGADATFQAALLLVDTSNGSVLAEVNQEGFDLAVDGDHGVIWVVGQDIKMLTLDMQLQFAIDPIAWFALSVDFTSTGSAWVAVGEHPDVPGSSNRLLEVDPTGTVLREIPLDFKPKCVRVDRSDDSLWVAGGGAVHKFTADGVRLFSRPGPSFTLCIRGTDGSVWAAGHSDQVVHYSSTGQKLHGLSGFSTDQAWISCP